MAITYTFNISNRVRTSTQTLSDDTVVADYVDAIAVFLAARDDESGISASTDPWVSLANPKDIDPETYVPWADMETIPAHIKATLDAWGEDATNREYLVNQIEMKKSAPVEKTPPWAAA